jgi:carbonic anhydrase
MLAALIATCLALASQPPHDSAPAIEATKAQGEAPVPQRTRPVRPRAAAVAVPEETLAPEKAKPAPRRPVSSAAVVEQPAPRRVVTRRPAAPPVQAQPVPAGDLRAARLETQNALLRQQLAQTQQAPGPIGDAQAALAELVAGNRRFVEGTRVRTQLSIQDPDLRATLAKGQSPFAVIVTCSDSRLVDNLIFDQELGRLFTIREAGNSPDTQSLASVEYALEHLGARLVVVLGHSHCGAVKAVAEAHGRPLPGNLWSLQAAMTGLLESTYQELNEDEEHYEGRLVRINARRQAQAVLDRSEIVRERVAKGRVKVVAAYYDLATGKVDFEPEVGAAHGGPLLADTH